MDALELSKKHEQKWLPIDAFEDNPENPNKMSKREFDLLVDNILQKGMTEPVEVVFVHGPNEEWPSGRYRIIGGHHRKKACKFLGWPEAPAIINNDPDMDEDKERAQIVRMNVIHGKMDPEAFVKMYEKMSKKYSDEVLQDMLGFADEKEFQKLIRQTGESLPPEMKKDFEQAVKEVRTIEDLAKVLNHLFENYGDTLNYGYMIFDFNGKESVWLRMKDKDKKHIRELGEWCRHNKRSMDDVMSEMLRVFCEDDDWHIRMVSDTPEIDFDLPNHVAPTLDAIDG